MVTQNLGISMSDHLAGRPFLDRRQSWVFKGRSQPVILICRYKFRRLIQAVVLVLLLAACLPHVRVSCDRSIGVRQQKRMRERLLVNEPGNTTEGHTLQKNDIFGQRASGVNASHQDVYEDSKRVVPSCPDPLHILCRLPRYIHIRATLPTPYVNKLDRRVQAESPLVGLQIHAYSHAVSYVISIKDDPSQIIKDYLFYCHVGQIWNQDFGYPQYRDFPFTR